VTVVRSLSLLLLAGALGLLSCGYHVAGKGDLIPKGIQTISVPAFTTMSSRYRLVDLLPQQISREILAQTRFRIEADPSEADAVLNGTITGVQIGTSVVDPTTAKTSIVQITVYVTVKLVQRATGKVLFAQTNAPFRQNYNVAIDPHQFLDESGPAFDRLARNMAHDIVSAMMEGF
jgi:Lipopolysaccharide-assembly